MYHHTRPASRLLTTILSQMAVCGVSVVGGTPAIPPSLLYTDANNRGFLIIRVNKE